MSNRKNANSQLRRLLRNRKVVLGVVILVFFALLALVGPLVVHGDPNVILGARNLPPSPDHPLGTTGQGQDVLLQLVYGARSSLSVGLTVGLIATAFGTIVGLAAAYYGGWIDDALSLLTNVFIILPGLPLLVALAAFLPPGIASIILVLTLTGWAGTGRVVRAQTASIRHREFIGAATVSGERALRIMVREILPNMTSIIVGVFVGSVTYGITAQAGLEFLGLGDLSQVSWGTMLYWAGNNAALLQGAWWTFLPPGLCIALVGFALTLVNFGADEITNPRLRGGADARHARKLEAAARARSEARLKSAEPEEGAVA
jgi:peptide/nickel transport system permease protein